MKQNLLNKLWLRVCMIVAIMTTALSGTVWAEDVTDVLTATSFAATNTTYTDFTNVSFTSDAVYAGNSAKTSNGGIQLRSKNSNSGIVSTISGGKVKSVSITVESGSNTVDVYGSNTAYTAASDLYGNNKGTKLGSLSASGTVTVTDDYAYVGIRSNNGAIYLTNITIVWEVAGGSTPTVATPTFSPAAGTYTSAQSVTISSATEGATIYYTTDGTEPTTNSTQYNGAISVSSSTTIKAIATAAGYDNSSVATATYTIVSIGHEGTEADPYTVADARAAIDANTGVTEVYATGIVSAIPTAWSTTYNNITFNFVDNSGDEDFLQAFRCVSGTGVDASTVAVGDVVVVYGNLTKYGTTYEFAANCQLVSLTHPTAAVEAPIFSPDGGVFTTPQSVSFAVAAPTMEGYTFYYTLDGSEPTTQSTLYTGPIEVSTTTTIKAIAVKGGEVSLVTTATYAILAHAGTEADPYAVADARAAIDANAGLTDVYATGVVTEIATAWSTDHSNISFNFVDAAGDTDFLQAYRCVSTDAADASTVAVGDIVVVKGTLKKYNDIYEFGQGCQLVSLTHSGTPVADPVIVAEDATIDADVTYYELMYSIENPVEGTALTATTDAAWITSCTPSQKSFDRVMIECKANETTEDRTATIVLTYGTLTKEVTLTQKGVVAPVEDYAELPFTWEGGVKSELLAEAGVTAEGLGSDYAESNAPYRVKLDTTGDYIQVKTNERPGIVTIGVKMIGGANTSTITVQESADGETFTDVQELTISGAQNDVLSLSTTTDFAETSRYIRLSFTKGSNVGVGYISIAKYEEPAPALYVRPNEIAATADGATGTLTITAEGITLTPNDQLYIEFHDADGGPLPAAPDWITTEVTTGEAGFVVNYTIAANQGEARSTFFQVVAAEYKLFSNPVTVSQEAYTAPATGDQFALYYGDLVEGDYIIYYDGKAMSNEVANNRLQYAEVTPENDIITTDNEAIVWHIAPSGEYWTIYSPAAKAYAASNGTKNQAQMLVDADDHALWSVEAMATHVAHEFTNKANAAAGVNAVLRNNGTYGFACYSVNTGGAVQLYKKVESFVPTVQTVTVTDAGYATFVAEKNLEIPTDVLVEVFAVTVEGSYASLQPIVGNIPAGEAVLVKASAGDYNFLSAQTADPIRVNKLVAATTDVVADGTQYVLANGASGIGFYQATPGSTIPAGKAYLVVTAAGVKPFYGFEDDATGIEMVNGQSSMVNDPIFKQGSTIVNLAGQRLQKMQRGINIIGGKKVLK